jgi:hypothetical protein
MVQLFRDLIELTAIHIPAVFTGILAAAGIPATAAVASLVLLLLIMSLLIMPFSFRGRHCCLKPYVAILLFLDGKLRNIFCTAKILNVDFFVKRGWRKCMQDRKGCFEKLKKKK